MTEPTPVQPDAPMPPSPTPRHAEPETVQVQATPDPSMPTVDNLADSAVGDTTSDPFTVPDPVMAASDPTKDPAFHIALGTPAGYVANVRAALRSSLADALAHAEKIRVFSEDEFSSFLADEKSLVAALVAGFSK